MPVQVRTSGQEPESLAERRRVWLERSHLYLVCDPKPGGGEPEEILRPALQGGVDIVQLRDSARDERELVDAGNVFRRLCDAYDALFIVNDDPEIAIACAADGVHLGQSDMDPAEARKVLGADAVIGLSTHSPEQIEKAEGVDYIGVGPIYRTPTKPDAEPVGLELVRFAADNASVPFFAIGGIDASNVSEVAAAGATRVAVVRAIRDAVDPGAAARTLKARISERAGVAAD